MKQDPEAYLKAPYSRILIPNDDGIFSAEILEFPGCFAEGKTPEEAYCKLEEAAKSWIEASLEQGLDIPGPAMNHGYSGKIALRLPRSLHRQAARMAERDGISLNQFLVTAIATRLGAEDLYARLSQRFEQRPAPKTGRQRFDKPNSLTVDASQVNPALKRRSTSSTRKVSEKNASSGQE